MKEAIEAFQIKLNNKRRCLAFYIRKSIHNCYDAMTTSPCESMNRHIKHTSKATTRIHLDTVFCTPSTEEHVQFDAYELRIPSEN